MLPHSSLFFSLLVIYFTSSSGPPNVLGRFLMGSAQYFLGLYPSSFLSVTHITTFGWLFCFFIWITCPIHFHLFLLILIISISTCPVCSLTFLLHRFLGHETCRIPLVSYAASSFNCQHHWPGLRVRPYEILWLLIMLLDLYITSIYFPYADIPHTKIFHVQTYSTSKDFPHPKIFHIQSKSPKCTIYLPFISLCNSYYVWLLCYPGSRSHPWTHSPCNQSQSY